MKEIHIVLVVRRLILVVAFLKMKKSQANIELLYSIGTILILFLIITLISFDKNIEIKKTKDFVEKRNDCLKIANFILETFINNINITTSISYNLSIIPAQRLIYIEDLSCTIPINQVNATSLGKGSISFYKQDDKVFIK